MRLSTIINKHKQILTKSTVIRTVLYVDFDTVNLLLENHNGRGRCGLQMRNGPLRENSRNGLRMQNKSESISINQMIFFLLNLF